MSVNYTNPLISIIIPFFNREADLINAIRSVKEQTYTNWELILVNDGSVDQLDKLAEEIANNPKIQLIHINKSGAAAARNIGIGKSKGEFIAFLDSDDLFLPTKLEKQLLAIRDRSTLFSHSSYLEKEKNGNKVRVVNTGVFTGSIFPELVSNCPIATPTVMLHRSLLDSDDLFPTSFHMGEDICAWIKIASKSSIVGIEEPLSVVHVNQESAINNPAKQIEGFKNVITFIETGFVLSSSLYAQLSNLHRNISVNYKALAGQEINEFSYLKAMLNNKFGRAALVAANSLLASIMKLKRRLSKN